MDPVSQLRTSLLPILQSCERELKKEHPNLTTNIYDWPIGKLTSWQGHEIGIECLFKNIAPEWPDNIAFSVSLKHLNKTPSIDSADVVWGHPSGYIEASLLPASVEFSSDSLAKVDEGLPELFGALQQAIRRGRPVD